MMINILAAALVGYLLGNLSTAYLVVRQVMHADIRELGSGNAGATNVNRVLGIRLALLVFVLDMLKGIVAVVLGGWLAGQSGALVGGLAAVLGHDWPILLDFRGGKGMATTLGILLVLLPREAALAVVVFMVVVALTRYVSLASMAFCLVIPLLSIILGEPPGMSLFTASLAMVGVFQHRRNIERLLKGSESRLVLTRTVNS